MDYAKVTFSDEDLGLLDVPSDESLKYIGGLYLATRSFENSNRISLRNELSPANLYLYLLGRFGPPNGVLTLLRKRDERAKRTVLWHYTLAWRKRHVHFICHTFRVDVIFGPGLEVDINPADFASMLGRSCERHSNQMSKARAMVEKYRSSLNPLSQLLDSITRMLVRAEELDAGQAEHGVRPLPVKSRD